MSSSQDPGPDGIETQAATPFAQDFEQQLNRELLIASFEEGSKPSTPQEAETTSSSAQSLFSSRGLQIPSRSKSPLSGWKFAPVLENFGIAEADWKIFTNEISSYAALTKSQWAETIGKATGTIFIGGLAIGLLAIIPGVIVGKKWRERQEKQNLQAASDSGALLRCIERWNKDYFFSRGLAVRVDAPGAAKADMSKMEILSHKGSSKRSETSSVSTHTSSLTKQSNEDTRYRDKAAKRGRIVLIPLDTASTTTENERLEIISDDGSKN